MNMSDCNLCGMKDVARPDQSPESDMHNVDCPDCGKYSIAGLEALRIPYLSPEDKKKLQAVVAERSKSGISTVIVAQSMTRSTAGKTIDNLLAE